MKYSTLIYDMSSEAYHSTPNSVSSSQLKTILEDPKAFFEKYIEKSVDREHIAAFDVGSYFHTALLEPHKLKEEFAFYSGQVRNGEKFNKFKKKNPKKIILTESQKKQGDNLVKAVRGHKRAMKLLGVGKEEVSLFVRLRISDGKIYAIDHNSVLTKTGWKSAKVPKSGTDITAKVRADKISFKYKRLIDLKSTSSADPEIESDIQDSVEYYNYGMSAAFYMDMYTVAGYEMKDFYWIYSSKKTHTAEVWQASPECILEGRANWASAILKVAEGIETEWKFNKSKKLVKPSANYKETLARVWG